MAVTFDAATTVGSGGTPADSVSFAHVCTGSDLVLFADVQTDRTVDTAFVIGNGITCNGVAFIKLGDIDNGTDLRFEKWVFAGPPAGSNTIQVTFDSACGHIVSVSSYAGSDGTLGLMVPAYGSDDTPLVVTESAAGEMVADAVAVASSTSITAGAGETANSADDVYTSPADGRGVSGHQDGAGTVTSTYTLGAPASWMILAVPIHAGTQTVTVQNTQRILRRLATLTTVANSATADEYLSFTVPANQFFDGDTIQVLLAATTTVFDGDVFMDSYFAATGSADQDFAVNFTTSIPPAAEKPVGYELFVMRTGTDVQAFVGGGGIASTVTPDFTVDLTFMFKIQFSAADPASVHTPLAATVFQFSPST